MIVTEYMLDTNVCVPTGYNPPPPGTTDLLNMNARKKRRIDAMTSLFGTMFAGKNGPKWEVTLTTGIPLTYFLLLPYTVHLNS